MPAPTPMLAATAREWPSGEGWVLQPKWDGFRLLVEVGDSGRVRAYSRHATELTRRLDGLLDPLAAQGRQAVLDGELVALAGGDQGVTQDFAAVGRAALHGDANAARQLHYVVFDVLALDGVDFTARPLADRMTRLADALPDDRRVRVVATHPADLATHERIVALGFEGTVLKRAGSAYRPGRHNTWRKHKARHRLAATVHRIGVSREGRPYAICALDDGRRITAAAMNAHAWAGESVQVVYSRQDANGDLREARLAPRPDRGPAADPAGAGPLTDGGR